MAKTEVKVKIPARLSKLIEENIEEIKNEIGDKAVKSIKGETKRGFQLENNIEKKNKQPELKTSTVESRKRLSKFNKTGKPFRPDFSNLTLTGQLIDAVQAVDSAKNSVKIQVSDTQRKPYKTSKDGDAKNQKSITNKQLAEYLADKGRHFIGLDKKTIELIIKRIRFILRRSLKS